MLKTVTKLIIWHYSKETHVASTHSNENINLKCFNHSDCIAMHLRLISIHEEVVRDQASQIGKYSNLWNKKRKTQFPNYIRE